MIHHLRTILVLPLTKIPRLLELELLRRRGKKDGDLASGLELWAGLRRVTWQEIEASSNGTKGCGAISRAEGHGVISKEADSSVTITMEKEAQVGEALGAPGHLALGRRFLLRGMRVLVLGPPAEDEQLHSRWAHVGLCLKHRDIIQRVYRKQPIALFGFPTWVIHHAPCVCITPQSACGTSQSALKARVRGQSCSIATNILEDLQAHFNVPSPRLTSQLCDSNHPSINTLLSITYKLFASLQHGRNPLRTQRLRLRW